jgi:hypothetical protein
VNAVSHILKGINQYSQIDGFSEFYYPCAMIVVIIVWVKYFNSVFYAATYQEIDLHKAAKLIDGNQIKFVLSIMLAVFYVTITLGILILVFSKLPVYFSKPFFTIFNWLVGVLFGIVFTCSSVACLRATDGVLIEND